MPDTFTKTTTTGWGTRLGQSIAGVFVGILMFLASFGVLYWNEGRVDLSSIALEATPLAADVVTSDTALQGTLVSVTGEVTSAETVGDDMFLKPGPYLRVVRNVEMYAWVEETEEESNTNLGGSETTTTTYNYKKEWTDAPKDESTFEYPTDHENPSLTVEGDVATVDKLTVGVYTVDGAVEMPAGEQLTLKDSVLSLSSGAERASDEYVFMGTGSLASPVVGDVRISYEVLNQGFTGTVIGELDRSAIVKYTDKDGNSMFRVFNGGRDEAVATLRSEYTIMMWVFRGLGFLMMWLGLAAVIGPIATFLDVLPFLGKTTRFLASVVTFPIALVLSVITILISMVLHSLVAVVIVGVLLLAGLLIFLKMRRGKTPQAVK